jgi:hypothetical protein
VLLLVLGTNHSIGLNKPVNNHVGCRVIRFWAVEISLLLEGLDSKGKGKQGGGQEGRLSDLGGVGMDKTE